MIEAIKTLINGISSNFHAVKSDVNAVKSDVNAVKSDVNAVKSDVNAVKLKQPNWNEEDISSNSYVQNKPCYDYIDQRQIVIYSANPVPSGSYGMVTLGDIGDMILIEGEEYTLTIDGVSTMYTCSLDDDGNLHVHTIYQSSSGGNLYASYSAWNNGSSSVELKGPVRRYKKLDASLYDAVTSVNGQTGEVTLTASDVGAVNLKTSGLFMGLNGSNIIRMYTNGVIAYYLGNAYFGAYNDRVGIMWANGTSSDNMAQYLYQQNINTDDDGCVANLKYVKDIISSSAIPIPSSATVGQIIKVSAVDENGVPTAWEVADPMVVLSSTEGSTKKFKITVDDSGTISAAEVTE